MTKFYGCDADACTYQQETLLPFQVVQRLDETDDDGDPIEVVFDLCSGECLSNVAMGLSLDFPEETSS